MAGAAIVQARKKEYVVPPYYIPIVYALSYQLICGFFQFYKSSLFPPSYHSMISLSKFRANIVKLVKNKAVVPQPQPFYLKGIKEII